MESRYPTIVQSWVVWGLGACLYFSGFYQRVAPAVMTDELMSDFGIGAAALGNLSAFYYYSYVAMQIPTGLLADYWGPRKLLSYGSLIAAAGTFLFAAAPNAPAANTGRLLIGGSVAVAFVALLKIAAHWFHPRYFAMLSGIALLVGVAGAVTAGVPLRLMVDHYGWRPVMGGAGFVTLIVAAAVWWFVRDDPSEKGYKSFNPSFVRIGAGSGNSLIRGLRRVLTYRNTWLLTLAPSGLVGPVLAFSGLWGVPFLTTHYGLSPAQAAGITSGLMVAWAVGGPVLGGLSDRIGRRKPLYLGGCIVAATGWTAMLFSPGLSIGWLTALSLLVGFASGSMIIGFAFVKESVPPSLAGTVSGVCNMGVMLGPMVLQPAIGWILDRNWMGRMAGGVRIYDLAAYRWGFILMVAWAISAALLILCAKETHCSQRFSEES